MCANHKEVMLLNAGGGTAGSSFAHFQLVSLWCMRFTANKQLSYSNNCYVYYSITQYYVSSTAWTAYRDSPISSKTLHT
jgi:hypothetical protein